MELDELPLGFFMVNCDGSACGSGDVPIHVHPTQYDVKPLLVCVYRKGKRERYEKIVEPLTDEQRKRVT